MLLLIIFSTLLFFSGLLPHKYTILIYNCICVLLLKKFSENNKFKFFLVLFETVKTDNKVSNYLNLINKKSYLKNKFILR